MNTMKNRKLMITAAVAIRKRCGGMNNMNNRLIGIMVVLAFAGMVTSARGGSSLDAPAAPTNPASAMFTLEDIYNKLDTRAAVSKRTGGFTEPTAGPTSGTMHTLNDIMTLVTNRAPAPKTGQTLTVPLDPAPVGSDGYLQIGVAWPTQRFTAVAVSGNATNQIRDNLTGLIWARNANLASNTTWATWSSVKGTCTWYQAFDVITNSAGPVNGTLSGPNGYGGTNDWRLPNRCELLSLIALQYQNPALSDGTGTNKWTEALGPFTGVQFATYWSSATYAVSTASAWDVYLSNGDASYDSKTGVTGYVWPVRGGQ